MDEFGKNLLADIPCSSFLFYLVLAGAVGVLCFLVVDGLNRLVENLKIAPRTPSYWPPFLGAVSFAAVSCIAVPAADWRLYGISLFLAALGGVSVGMTELMGRYKDDPIRATLAPFGVLYLIINAAISFIAALLLVHFSSPGAFEHKKLLLALVAGFGATAVMRSKISVYKGSGQGEIAIGLDAVIKALLALCDVGVDRLRAEARSRLVIEKLPDVIKFGRDHAERQGGEFAAVTNYVTTSLLSFQHPDEAKMKELTDKAIAYEKQKIPLQLKYMAFCFALLNLVGERNFRAILEDIGQIPNVEGSSSSESSSSHESPASSDSESSNSESSSSHTSSESSSYSEIGSSSSHGSSDSSHPEDWGPSVNR